MKSNTMSIRSMFVVIPYFICNMVVTVSGATPFFWDEFNRDDLYDSPLDWVKDESPEEEYRIEDGSLIVSPLADKLSDLSVRTPTIEDFVVRTLVRVESKTSGFRPFLHIAARDHLDGVSNNYWAGYTSNGTLLIGENANGQLEIGPQTSAFSFEQTQQDVHMHFTAVGNHMTFTAWLDGEEMPNTPQLELFDDSLAASELVSVVINPSQDLEEFAVRYLALLPAIPGDFNASKSLDAQDIDLLSKEVRNGGGNRALDLTDDSFVNSDDRMQLISSLFNTYIGDSNLDGEFNSSDFVQVFATGGYEDGVPMNSTWAKGDWNGDGDFDSTDFVVAFQDGGFEQGPRIEMNSVPEPSSFAISMVAVIGIVTRWRRGEG